MSFLRTFGCIGHVRKTKPNLTKLEDRSTPMVFLGYAEGTKAYRLYDPRGDKVLVPRDVVFDEKAAWDKSSPRRGKLAASPTPSLSSTWSSTVVETLGKKCRARWEECRAL